MIVYFYAVVGKNWEVADFVKSDSVWHIVIMTLLVFQVKCDMFIRLS